MAYESMEKFVHKPTSHRNGKERWRTNTCMYTEKGNSEEVRYENFYEEDEKNSNLSGKTQYEAKSW